MSSKTPEEYKRVLIGIVECDGDLDRYCKLLFEWVKTGKVSRRQFLEVQSHVHNLLLQYN